MVVTVGDTAPSGGSNASIAADIQTTTTATTTTTLTSKRAIETACAWAQFMAQLPNCRTTDSFPLTLQLTQGRGKLH